jgi:hypothetical protein
MFRRIWQVAVAPLLIALFLASPASAVTMDLVAAPDLIVAPGAISGPMQLGVEVGGTGSDIITQWSADLFIVGLADSIGTLAFSSVDVPLTDYIFDGIAHTSLDLVATDLEHWRIETTPPLGGAAIDAGEYYALADIEFAASLDASGSFGIFVNGIISSWTDADPPGEKWDNAPCCGLTQLATVVVSSTAGGGSGDPVPEPTAALLFGMGFVVFGIARRSRGH